MFALVNFVEENKVAVVSTKWMQGNICFWPTCKNQKDFDQLLRKSENPNFKTWTPYPARLLKSYDTILKARQHLANAQCTSDISDGEVIKTTRRRKEHSKVHELTSSDEEIRTFLTSKKATTKTFHSVPTPPDQMFTSKTDFNTTQGSVLAQTSVSSLIIEPRRLVLHEQLDHDFGTQMHFSQTCTDEPPYINSTSDVTELTNVCDSNKVTILQDHPPNLSSDSLGTYYLNLLTADKVSTCTQTHAEDLDAGFKEFVVRTLTNISQRLGRLENKVDSLKASSDLTFDFDEISSPSSFLPNLPIQTVIEFEAFDRKICQCNETMKSLCSVLSKLGGRNIDDCVKRMMDKILSDEVARLYSFKGQKGKFKFCSLNSYMAILGTLQKKKIPNLTEELVEKKVAERLKHATTRLNRRSNGTTTGNPENLNGQEDRAD